jgi:pimeloyl-ACP methyl ester carboxylesterase
MSQSVPTREAPSHEPSGKYAPVNGLNMYYEIHGTGEPLVLIHGGFGVSGMFEQLLPTFTMTRQVITVELQGHGHTADIDRPFSYEQLADDVAGLIKHLGFANADVLGYSLGGGVALQTAIRHPDVVRRLVVISAPYKRDGWYPEVLAGMGNINAEGMAGTPLYKAYISVAPKPEDWSHLANKTRQLLAQDYNWAEQVTQAVKAPVLIVIGDADSISPAHASEMFALLGGGMADGGAGNRQDSQLAVLPGTTHYNIILRTDLLPPIIMSFLNAPVEKEK